MSGAAPTTFQRPPREVDRLIRRLRWRLRLAAALRGAGITAAAAGILFLGAVLLDRFVVLPGGARPLLTFGALAIGALCALGAGVLPILRPLRPEDLARRIEARERSFRGSLLSVVELSRAGQRVVERCSQPLLDALWTRTAAGCAAVQIRPLVDTRRSWRALAAGVIVLAAAGACAALDSEGFRLLARRFLHPRTELPRPTRVELAVEPGSALAPRGEPVELRARVVRGEALEAWVLLDTAGGSQQRASMETAPAGGARGQPLFTFKVPALRRRLEYRVEAGDYVSPSFVLEPRDPPRAGAFSITYRFPAYARLPAQTLASPSGDLSALKGSVADVDVDVEQDLSAALAEVAGGGRIETRVEGSRLSVRGVPIEADGAWKLTLVSREGVSNGGRASFRISALADRAPRAEIVAPRVREVEAEAGGSVELRFRADDDVGLAGVDLVALGSEEEVVAAVWSAGATPGRILDRVFLFSLASRGLRPADALRLAFRARDVLGQEGCSQEILVRVAYNPDSPEGPRWLSRLRALEEAVADLDPEREGTGGDWQAAAAWTLRARSASREALAMGRSLRVPSPWRRALEGLGFALDAEMASPDLQALRQGLGALVRFERLEDVASRLRLLDRDLALLGADVRAAKTPAPAAGRVAGIGANPDERLALLRAEVQRCADELEALAPEEGVESSLRARARAIGRSLTEDAPAATAQRGDAGLPPSDGIARLQAALASRRADLEGDIALRRRELARYRRLLRARPQPGSFLAALAVGSEAAGQDREEAAAAMRGRARRAIRAVEFVEASSRSFDYADFESTALLGAVSGLLEPLLEPLPDSGATSGAGGERVRRLAAAWTDIEPLVVLGAHVQELDWIAAGAEDIAAGADSIARRVESIGQPQPRALEAARAAESDLAGAIEDVAQRLREDTAGAAYNAERAGLERAQEILAAAAASSREALQALAGNGPRAESPGTPLRRASGLAEEAKSAVEVLRGRLSSAAARSSQWLRDEHGTAAERLSKLGAEVRAHAEVTRSESSREPDDKAATQARLSDLVLGCEGHQRRTQDLAAELREALDRLVAGRGEPRRIEALGKAAARLVEVRAQPLERVLQSLRKAAAACDGDRRAQLEVAAREGEAAGEALLAVAHALDVLDADGVWSLEGEEIQKLLGESAGASESTPDAASVLRRAKLLLDASQRAGEELRARLRSGELKDELLGHLLAAAAHFQEAVRLAEAADAAAGWREIQSGLARFQAAVALARRLRGEAEEALAGPKPAPGGEDGKDAGAAAHEKELEEVARELAKLAELRRLEKEVEGLLEELLGKEPPSAEDIEEALRKERELAEALGAAFPGAQELLRLAAKLLQVDRSGREAAEAERYLEEEARRSLAAGTPVAALAGRQAEVHARTESLVGSFQEAGSKLTILLPRVFRSFASASGEARALVDALGKGLAALRGGDGAAAVAALEDANGSFGRFLARVGETRRSALEALADLESGAGGSAAGQLQLDSAVASLRQAAHELALGQLGEALSQHRAAGRSLGAAARSAGSRLGSFALPGGEDAFALGEKLGEGWDPSTQGEFTRGLDAPEEARPEDLPFPPAFRDIVRMYLEAIRRGER